MCPPAKVGLLYCTGKILVRYPPHMVTMRLKSRSVPGETPAS